MFRIIFAAIAALAISIVAAAASTLVSSSFTTSNDSSDWGNLDPNGWIYIEEKNDCTGFFGDNFSLCDVGNGLTPETEISPIVAKYETPDDGTANYIEEINSLFPSIDGSEFGLGGATGATSAGTWTYAQGAGDPDILYWAAKAATSFTLFWEVDSLANCTAGNLATNYSLACLMDAVAVTSGNWSTPTGAGLSHISFYDSGISEIPVPAGGLLLVGGLGLLAALRRRVSAA